MTRTEYEAQWTASYVQLVEIIAAALHADGCTGVPDFYLLGCLEHDIAYRTHRDPYGHPVDRDTADKRLRWYIQMRSPFGTVSPMAWWRWLAVRWWAKKAWARTPMPFPKL